MPTCTVRSTRGGLYFCTRTAACANRRSGVPAPRGRLPANAIGKGYLGWRIFSRVPIGTVAQVSLFGVLGVAAAVEEGLELNVLGLTFGLDPKNLALKLPLVGRIGPGGVVTATIGRPGVP